MRNLGEPQPCRSEQIGGRRQRSSDTVTFRRTAPARRISRRARCHRRRRAATSQAVHPRTTEGHAQQADRASLSGPHTPAEKPHWAAAQPGLVFDQSADSSAEELTRARMGPRSVLEGLSAGPMRCIRGCWRSQRGGRQGARLARATAGAETGEGPGGRQPARVA